MTLALTLTPSSGYAPLPYAIDGDVLTVGGVAYDFGQLGEGEVLPHGAVPGRWLVTDLERADGVVTLTAVEAVAPFGTLSALAPGDIDWSQVTTAAERSAARLAAWRASVSLPTVDFALAAMRDGHLPEAEAEAWITRQTTPAVVATAIASLPAPARTEARLRIRGAPDVRRSSPFVALLQAHMGLNDAQVDALFGTPPA